MLTWTEQDFELMSWHDCSVHGFGISEADEGKGTLTLDIDYITSWEEHDGRLAWQVAPATLVFFGVHHLKIGIHYDGIAISPFVIEKIDRAPNVAKPGWGKYCYRILTVPRGSIEFTGERFTQILRALPVLSYAQQLGVRQRAGLMEDGGRAPGS